jgi:uncharacterized metal-binding protein YceD (DUF177 family)
LFTFAPHQKLEWCSMNRMRQYQIAFVGLKTGIQHFYFQIDEKFFEVSEYSLIKKAMVEIDLTFNKQSSYFMLDFSLSGKVNLPCDRCEIALDFPIDSQYQIVVKFDDHHEEQQDDSMADVIYISRNDAHLDVSQLIYEFITLSVPLHKINCDNIPGEKKCDNEILNQLSRKDFPLSSKRKKDPRWDNLTKIKFN